MFKIKALNQESSSDEDVPTIRREAQEEIALELYNDALRAQKQKQYDASANILTKLLEENIPQLENNGGLPKSMSTLKYSCYLNLGNIYLNQDNVTKALENFSTASELDPTDVTLWAKIGKLALKESKFNKAAYAFSKGLECSESHWPCLDNLISVLFAIKDTVSCLCFIGKALILDGEYTKGIVLRKQIYRDNPATREYYRLFNPEHIYEPPIDIDVNPEEEEEILKEAQLLCDRVTEAEKAVGRKPIPTIPLPKPLEEYTWLSLAKTITFCHQYITDHNMGHLTIFDMTRCMSQSGESSEIKSGTKLVEDMPIIKDNKPEIKTAENPTETAGTLEKMDTESVPMERRFSQNSENTTGNDVQDNTPIQTDNDEEQNMELDNDETDGDNLGDTPDTSQQRKRGKRKRDVLSDLQIWGWHSKRKPPKKLNKDFTVEDALNRIIPKSLLKTKITSEMLNQGGEDSMNTMDIYNMYIENKELNFLSPIHSPKSVNFEAYFGTDRERDDVVNFWTKERPQVDAMWLVKDLVFELSKLWRYKWPKELVPLYIQAFKMFREHCDQPQPFCGEETFDQIRDDALATLLFGELASFSSDTGETVHPMILGYLQIVCGWSQEWKDEYPTVFIRYCWLQSHCFRKSDENELAITPLEVILEQLDTVEANTSERFSLSLSNCFKYGFISREIIEKIIRHLNMIISLGNVENLFDSKKYAEAAEVLKQTFHSGSYTKVGKMGRPAQLGILMHSLWFTDWEQCFVWTEECLNEAVLNYGKTNADHDKWEMIVEKCLLIFQEIIKKETVCVIDKLPEDKRCRLVESLVKVICRQLNTEAQTSVPLGLIQSWIVLHYVILREEHRLYAKKRLSHPKRDKMLQQSASEPADQELPPSVAILFSAHEFLGPKSWCLNGNGELLHFILDTVLDRLDTPIFERYREKMDIHIEQALFCLYSYPSKKNKISRHLVDHNVEPIKMTWERSFQLYQYYAPDSLPEFNSYKSQSITADLEQLFKQIIGLAPTICALHDHLPKIMDFIHGKINQVPEPVEFPGRVRAIYYLLGDYYFKEKEFARCIKYFQLDLCISPMRLDAWASLGLSYAAQLENTLNYCEPLKNESDFFDKAKSAQVCFRKALELDPENLVLWIECGSFEYMVHSFCSRLIKFESENFNMEKFELLETEKESYLDSSGNSLEHAIGLYEIDDSNEPDERWLQYYILGKIAEKKRKEPAEYLQYYMTASVLLHENKATYPDKINYNNPQHLSVEALELHYRVHASILKYLELHEGKDILNTLGTFFRKCLNSTAKRYIVSPPTPIQAPKTVDVGLSMPSSATSFQEQFLNSIKNPTNDDVMELPEDDEDAGEIVKACLEDLLVKVNDVVEDKDGDKINKSTEEVKMEQDSPVKADEKEDMDVTIIENEEVVMVISDSEEESVKNNAEEKDENKETMSVIVEQKPVEDVQSLLDQMMAQTMKDTEKMDYSDPNNSGTEQVEEVVVKEDMLDPKQSEKTEAKGKAIPRTPKNSETDTENKKTTADEDTSSSSSSSSDSSSADSDSDDSGSSSSSSSSDSCNENMSHSETLQLVDKCIQGLEVCITRLPQNYKALYRLAHIYFNYKSRKDYTKCKQLLLGEYRCKDDSVVNGLFADRNTKNFFNGIWRIPSTEIDRPGSLAAHMNRCISLMLQVLRNTNDTKTLMELCMQLRKAPDRDKIYIRDSDRVAFSDQAMDMCVQSFRGQIKNIPNMLNQQITKLLHDIFRVYQRVQKHASNKESVFSGLLADAYRKYIKEKIPDNVNVFDLAMKFCQQHKLAEKHKSASMQSSGLGFVSRGPGIANPPVHPTPSALVPSQKPLKPPTVGRPRGRPPLPKIPGQVRPSRAKSPSASIGSYPWQNPMYGSTNFSYEYLKHYQEELIKQYSQNLSLSQLNQLTTFFSSGQLNNPAIAQAVANQFLTQSGLLNPSSALLRPSTSGVGTGAIPTPTSTSFLDPQKGFNPQLSPALANLTPEQMKFLETMLPNMPKQTKSSSSSSMKSGISTASSSLSTKGQTSMASMKQQQDYSKLKPSSTSAKSSEMVFKEPSPSKIVEDKSANLLMKDRPNISITPVGSFSVTPTTTSVSQSVSKPSQMATPSISSSSFSKASSVMHSPLPSFSITKHSTSPTKVKPVYLPTITSSAEIAGHSKPKPAYIPTITSSAEVANQSKPKPTYISTITSSAAFSKPVPPPSSIQVPVAHSSASPKPMYSMPVTPPPVSSPSFIKPGMSTSPGKTLQEKLADKKKEQETKQMMKNIEADIFAHPIPSTSSAGLLKGLNLPNIPSSLSVSPSTSVNPMVPPYSVPMGIDKQPSFSKFPKSKSPVHSVSHPVGEHKLPSSLTVSKSLPPPAYTPRFPAESGISISQIVPSKTKDRSPPSDKQHSRVLGPVSLDESVEISPVLSHSTSPTKPSKDSIKQILLNKQKPIISVKADLYAKESSSSKFSPQSSQAKSRDSTRHSKLGVLAIPEKQFSSAPKPMKQPYSKQADSGRKALSVIKTLPAIDITPLSTGKKETTDDDIICID